MKGQKVLFSKESDEWETPPELLERLKGDGFRFAYDLAANNQNAKALTYTMDIERDYEDIKEIKYSMKSTTGWCNPPYSKCGMFCKIISELQMPVVMLLPARTDTKWFHEFIYNKENVRIEFLKGRLKFSGSKNSAPFPSMLVYFRC